MPDITRWLRTLLLGESAIMDRLDHIHKHLERIMTQNDDVLALVDTLGTDVDSMKTSLSGISGDVTDLKAQIAALPVGEPLDQSTLDALNEKVADVSAVTDAFASLDAETPAPPTE